MAVLKLLYDSFLYLVHLQVQVSDGFAFCHVSQEFNRIHLPVRLILCRRVDKRYAVCKLDAYVLFKEFLRCDTEFLGNLIILVLKYKIKFLRRFTKRDAEHAVDLADKTFLHSLYIFCLFARLNAVTQIHCIFPQLSCQIHIKPS